MRFEELREKFDNISYDSFTYKENENDLDINYFYQMVLFLIYHIHNFVYHIY